jgi:ferric-dicitrate binding protein FerR (iron transport regulator)
MSAFSLSSYDAVRRVFWKDNTLHMSGATIGEVVAQLNVRETQQIVIDDPRIAATLLPSTFVTQYTLDKFLSLIEGSQSNIEVQRRDDVAHLMFKPSSPIRPEAHSEQQHRDGRG